MTKPYPMELRLRAVLFVEAGESRHAVAKRLGVSVSYVIKWLQRFSKTGSVAPDQIGGYRPVKIIGEYRIGLQSGMRLARNLSGRSNSVPAS